MTFSPPPDGAPATAVLDDGPAAGETVTTHIGHLLPPAVRHRRRPTPRRADRDARLGRDPLRTGRPIPHPPRPQRALGVLPQPHTHRTRPTLTPDTPRVDHD